MRYEFRDTAVIGAGSVGEADADWTVTSDEVAHYTSAADVTIHVEPERKAKLSGVLVR